MDWAKYDKILDSMAVRIKDGSAVKDLAKRETWIKERLEEAREARQLRSEASEAMKALETSRSALEAREARLKEGQADLEKARHAVTLREKQLGTALDEREAALKQREGQAQARETRLERLAEELKAEKARLDHAEAILKSFKEAV